CQLRLQDRSVSRRHACIRMNGSSVVVTDLGSRNGTFVGEVRIDSAEVPLGAVVRLGRSSIATQARWFVREVPPSRSPRFGDVIGPSLAMREVFAVLERAAPTDATVLVEGESGTGKEMVARSIHLASGRARGPYVVFDCSAIPKSLAE